MTIAPQPAVTHRSVLAIAVPIMLSNVTEPLIGVVNTTVIGQLPQDRTNLAQAPLIPSNPSTRFRVTFNGPGLYQYICVLHDELGMVGQILVLP